MPGYNAMEFQSYVFHKFERPRKSEHCAKCSDYHQCIIAETVKRLILWISVAGIIPEAVSDAPCNNGQQRIRGRYPFNPGSAFAMWAC
jgi:hypothetical protein